MALIAGYTGSVSFNSVDLDAVSWTLEVNQEMVDVTQLSNTDTHRQYTTGRVDFTATVDALCDPETDRIVSVVGTSATLTLWLDGSRSWQATAYCQDAEIIASNDDVVKVRYTFVGNSATVIS